jgi:hypothetical protein
MKKYMYFALLMSVVHGVNALNINVFAQDLADKSNRRSHMRVAVNLVHLLHTNRGLAARHDQYVSCHAKKKNRNLYTEDSIVDLFGYLGADYVAGKAMAQLPITKFHVNDKHDQFIKHNLHLALASGITQGVHRSIDGTIAPQYLLDFGKNSACQVAINGMDVYVVEPVVKQLVGDESTVNWATSGAIRLAANLAMCTLLDQFKNN